MADKFPIWLPKQLGMGVRDSGTDLPRRGWLNFTGAGVTLVDDSTNDQITITIAGGGGPDVDAVVSGPSVAVQPAATGARSLVGGDGASDGGKLDVVSLGTGATCGDKQSVAIGRFAHANEQDCVAIGSGAQCGTFLAHAKRSTALGAGALTAFVGECNVANSPAIYAAFASVLVMQGDTGGPGSVELTLADGSSLLANPALANGTYMFVVEAVAFDNSTGITTIQFFRQAWGIVLTGPGTYRLVGADPSNRQWGDAGGSGWTLVGTIEATPARFALTFTAGADVVCYARVGIVTADGPA